MKRISSIIFGLIFMIIPSKAQSTFEANGIYYKIIKDVDEASTYGTVHITMSEGDDYQGDIVIPRGVQNGDGEFADKYKVTGIDGYAFKNNTTVTSLTLSPSIEYIAEEAFMGCDNLRTVIIPKGNLREIGNRVFFGCTGLVELDIPTSVVSIGRTSFSGCSKLEKVTLPQSIRSIDTYAFTACISLKEIIIPERITKIPAGVFGGCTNLYKVVLPSKLTSIGYDAFAHCTALTEINFPNTLTSIGDRAFLLCNSLIDPVLPESLTTIGHDAFLRF